MKKLGWYSLIVVVLGEAYLLSDVLFGLDDPVSSFWGFLLNVPIIIFLWKTKINWDK